jgi:hypothetical protein
MIRATVTRETTLTRDYHLLHENCLQDAFPIRTTGCIFLKSKNSTKSKVFGSGSLPTEVRQGVWWLETAASHEKEW